VITAPFDGIITERTVAPGAFVGPADKTVASLFRLKNESRLRLHVALPEKHIAEINPGDHVKFKVKSYPDKIYNGKISRLARSLSTQTRSEIIEIEIDNSGYHLLPGMYANVIIPLKRNTASLVVPESSIVTNMERSFVVKVSGETKPVWVDVQKGETENGMTEVFGELSKGDTILVTGSDETKENSAVRIMINEK
jgi:RND family efflux transporter MFP subunit